jgi:diketogulonate reductase-like aldo/keto reductase
VQASLEKLRITYIDLLYIHWWDYDTSIEEVMQSLHMLVQAGKVLYLVSGLLINLLENTDAKEREFRTRLHGSSPGRTNMPAAML